MAKTTKKKSLSTLLVVLLLALVAIGGMLAYLTDRDSEANIFTVGDVKIDLHETFEQGSALIPGNQVQKEVTIENKGKNDAWVWYTITYPKAIDLTPSGKTILWTGFTTENHDNSGYAGANDGEAEWLIEWTGAPYLRYFTDENGVEMVEFTVLYQQALAPGQTTPMSLECVYFDKAIDVDPNGRLYRVENGNTEAIDWNINKDGEPTIYISAYAIQKENFADVKAAYAAYQTQWGENGTEYATPAMLADNYDELKAALQTPGAEVLLTKDITIEKGIAIADNVTLDLNGYKIVDSSTGGRTLGIQNGVNVTIEGDGEIVKDMSVDSDYAMPLYVSAANVTVNGGTFNMGAPSGADYSILMQKEAKMIINDGIFTNNVNYPLFNVIWASELEINGGYFESIGTENPDLFDIEYHQTRISTITFKGGTFVNYDPMNDDEGDRVTVAEGYKVVSETKDNGDIWYTVVAE